MLHSTKVHVTTCIFCILIKLYKNDYNLEVLLFGPLLGWGLNYWANSQGRLDTPGVLYTICENSLQRPDILTGRGKISKMWIKFIELCYLIWIRNV